MPYDKQNMNELNKNLETYRHQLAQVESAILNGQEDVELLSLQQEMKELISLTEESLLAYEKGNLLSMLNDSNSNENEKGLEEKQPESIDDLMASFYSEINTSDNASLKMEKETDFKKAISATDVKVQRNSKNFQNFDSDSDELDLNDEFLKTIENSEDITGTKCQAPFETEWTGRQYHNAMIMNLVNNSEEDANQPNESIFVKVLFLNPTLLEMKPCPFFLDGKCRFDEQECKFSHGFSVSLYDLRKLKVPNFSNFTPGSQCLCKSPNGIWQPATLLQILDSHQYEVKFTQQDLTSQLNIDDILPLTHSDDSSDSEHDGEELDDDDDMVVIIDDAKSNISTGLDSFGQWEEFTTGFGSKMLKKYGYKMGDGLGKDKKGRVDPAPVVVLPPGKSLDHCMKLKEKKMGITDASTSSQPRRKQRHTVFHFLNKTLGDQKKGDNYLRKLLPKDSFGIKREKPKTGACKIQVELVKNDTKIKQLKEKISRYKNSIARNKTKDPGVAKKQQMKLNEVVSELKSLQSTNKVIEQHQNRADTHRKMTRF